MPAAVFAQHQPAALQPDVLRRHDFVRHGVLQHAVLMDTGFVRKRIAADDGLVGLHFDVNDRRQQPAGRNDLPRIDAGLGIIYIAPRANGHHHLLQRRIAGPLADAVHRAFHLICAVFHGGQCVGHGHAQVVVRVRAQPHLTALGHVPAHGSKHGAVFARRGIAHGVRQIDRGGAGTDGGAHDFKQKLELGAAGVLGGELHILGIGFGLPHGLIHGGQHFARTHAQLVLHVNGAGGDERMNARLSGLADGLPGAVDVFPLRAAERGHGHLANLLRNGLHGLEIALGRDGKTGFDDIHA